MKIEKLKIEKIAQGGFGLGFFEKTPVFVHNAYPCDLVDVETIHKKSGVYIAKLIKKHSVTIERAATCDNFGTCGGCDWLDLPYNQQLVYKEQLVNELFKKVTKLPVNKISASPDTQYYRNKSFLPVGMLDDKPMIGMFAKRTHQLINASDCQLHPQFFNEISQVFCDYIISSKAKVYNEKTGKGNIRHLGIRYAKATNQILIVIVTKSTKMPFTKQLLASLTKQFPHIVGIVQNINAVPHNRILGSSEKVLFGQDYLHDELGHIKLKVHYSSFYQINTPVATQIYTHIKKFIPPDARVLDAYAGMGSIGLFVADVAGQVACVESHRSAHENGIENAQLNKIENINFICGDAEKILPPMADKKFDVTIFDPPRKGLDKESINSCNSRTVIYISCNPATQVRDIEIFMQNDYLIKDIQPFDMFPHTYHTENVVIMEKAK